MAGVFSKGTPLSPEQQQLQQSAVKTAQNSANVFMPVQSFFAQQTQANQPGIQEMGRGQAAGTARAQGSMATGAGLNADANRGAEAGSGAFLADMAKGHAATAGATGMGLAGATAQGQQHYVKGLQDIVSMGQQDQGQGLQGMSTAAGAGQQEYAAGAENNQQNLQGAGQIVGLLGSLAAMS